MATGKAVGISVVYFINLLVVLVSQLTLTCSKPTIETLEEGVKYVQF